MPESIFNLQNKVALVTGASRGLGQGMAVGLAEAGADIIALSTNKDNLAQTAEFVKKTSRKILTMSCDVTKNEQFDAVLKKIVSEFGRIDILVNNAGTTRRASAEEFSDEDWLTVINTNLNATFHICREVAELMITRKSGKIINIASLLSFQGGISVPAYAASKGGVMQLTKALANEWAKYNIQVNAIAPGYFATEMTESLMEEDQRNNQITMRIPAGRWGTPQDLKGTVVYLASAASDYVNGHILIVDGGWMAR
jgi:2-dehydro-3-deoxy-D-gluconate 5-dehydrogenase